MRALLRLGSILLGIAVSVYFVIFAHRTATRYDLQSLCTWPVVVAIAIAAIGYASIIPTSSWAWARLLRGTGVRFPILQLNMIMGIAQMAKYVPGGIGQHLGRTAMSIQRGMPASALFVTLVSEMLLAIAAAMVVGLVGLVVAGRRMATLPPRHSQAAALAALCLAIALVGLLLAVRRSPGLARRVALHLAATRPVQAPRGRALGTAFVAYLLNYIVIGVGLYGIAFAVIRVPLASAPLFVGAFALSWIVGFVVPGAPAGLGVREGIMAALLTPPLAGARALEIIVAFRVATTLGDLLGLAWGVTIYLVERRTTAGSVVVSPGGDGKHGS